MVHRQALWLAPGRGLDATIRMLIDQLAERIPELAERRRDRPTAGASTTMTQRGDVAGSGLLIQAQDGSVHVDAGGAAQAPAGGTGYGRAERKAGMPFEGEVTTLAEAAAVALVTAMGTNAWTSVRDAVAKVFRRGGAKGDDKIADRLDDDASRVASAHDQAGRRAALEPFWRLEFMELVNAAPECAPDLAEITRVLDKAARPAAGKHLEQHTTVRDFGTAFVAQGGNVIMHGDPAPAPSSGAPQHPRVPDDSDTGAG